jgi:hypothetical protein
LAALYNAQSYLAYGSIILDLRLFDLHPLFQGNIQGIKQGLGAPSIAVFSKKYLAMVKKQEKNVVKKTEVKKCTTFFFVL